MAPPTLTVPAVPGEVVVWGSDVNGQISCRPRRAGFKRVAQGGASQGLALATNGIPELWGGVGAGSATKPIVPSLAVPPGAKYVDLAIGVSFAAGIRASDAGIDTWGDFASSSPGTPPESSALPSTFAGMRFVAVTAGGGFGVAIAEPDRSLLQWGSGTEGTEPRPRGVRFVEVRARNDSCLALDEYGDLFGWGGSSLFRPPHSTLSLGPPRPHPLAGTGWQYVSHQYWFHKGPFKAIAFGGLQRTLADPLPHVLGLKTDGSVVGWGANTYGAITNAPHKPLVAIAAGLAFSVGLDASGSAYHWGDPMHDGVGSKGLLEDVPTGPFVAIGAGTAHATAIRPANGVFSALDR